MNQNFVFQVNITIVYFRLVHGTNRPEYLYPNLHDTGIMTYRGTVFRTLSDFVFFRGFV